MKLGDTEQKLLGTLFEQQSLGVRYVASMKLVCVCNSRGCSDFCMLREDME